MPLLLVDLARVCGFRVKGAEEADIVGGKVRAALHESFAERSEELFETGSAVHADTSTLAEVRRQIAGEGGGDSPTFVWLSGSDFKFRGGCARVRASLLLHAPAVLTGCC